MRIVSPRESATRYTGSAISSLEEFTRDGEAEAGGQEKAKKNRRCSNESDLPRYIRAEISG